jgi:hypothetical protein
MTSEGRLVLATLLALVLAMLQTRFILIEAILHR